MTVVSRILLDHPALDTAGGSALHAAVEALYVKLGDAAAGRWYTAAAVANSAVSTIIHNFGVALSELRVAIYTGTHPNLTRVQNPKAAGWGITPTVGFEKTRVDITAPSSGGPHTFAVVLSQIGYGLDARACGIVWNAPAGLAAPSEEEFGQSVYKFPDAADVEIDAFLRVPGDYVPGSQILLFAGAYSPSTANGWRLATTSYLVRRETDAVDSTTNSRASTTAAVTNPGTANVYREVSFDITEADGKINSVAVSGGDLIRVKLTRNYADAGDTDTADVRVIPSSVEVKFQ